MKRVYLRDHWFCLVVLLLMVLLVACSPTPESEPAVEDLPMATEQPAPTEVPTLVEEIEPEAAIEPEADIEPVEDQELIPEIEETEIPEEDFEEEGSRTALEADPITQRFVTSDGEELVGTFYPADTVDAPVIVLLHWVLGDQNDWQVIAPWLQNRGLVDEAADETITWKDLSWFPEMPEGESFNVFTFNFRGCDGRCSGFDRDGWLIDVEAMTNHISQLEGVNLNQVVMMGASIGADGAANGCQFYNRDHGGCLGAYSLSPGGYLTIPFAHSVALISEATPSASAWCLFGEADVPSAATCTSVEAENYQMIDYPGQDHGMELLKEGLDPNPLMLFLQFLFDTGLCQNCQ